MEKYSLVLSGGGALGIAHIGVISNIQTKPSEIVGTSIGGIIGACYANNISSNEIYNLFKTFSKITKFSSFSFQGNSVIETNKIEKIFQDVFKDKKIGESEIPLKIIATHLETGDAHVFPEKIKISDALLATMAIPGIFPHKEIDNEIYVDGFLSANLPINKSSYDKVLAIDLLGFKSYDNEIPKSSFKPKNIFNMFEKSMRLMIINQTKQIIQTSQKDIQLIEVDTKNFNTYDFKKYEELFNLGKSIKIQI